MVFALNKSGEILTRYGISEQNVAGDYWKKQPGAMEQISGKTKWTEFLKIQFVMLMKWQNVI